MLYVSDEDGLYGRVPQSVIDDTSERLTAWHTEDFDIVSSTLINPPLICYDVIIS